MAGRLGLAAKIFLGTTVLAGGGAGTWYATTHELPSLNGLSSAAVIAQEDKESNADITNATEAADLDAVASAWDEPKSTAEAGSTQVASLESSPIARSAEVSNSGTTNPALSKESDRYALSATPPEGNGTRSETELAAVEPATDEREEAGKVAPSPAELSAGAAASEDAAPTNTSPTVSESQAKNEAELTEPAPDVASDPPAPPVARGQEPNDDSELQALTGDAAGSGLQPLTNEGKKTQTSSRALPTGNALREPAVAADSGRYSAASATRNTDATGNEPRSALVNPFAGSSTAGAAGAAAEATIEPLPSSASEDAGRLTELESAPNARPIRPEAELSRVPERADTFSGISGKIPAASGGTLPSNQLSNDLQSGAGQPSTTAGAAAGPEGAGRPGEKALEGPQRPSLEIQKFAPGEIQVGKPAKFVVRVRNVGTQAAEGVSIEDAVPQGTKLVSTTPEAQNAGGQLMWDVGKLSPGEDRTVEMQVMPVSEGEIGSVATVSYSAQASVKTKCTMPQLAIRMTAPAKVMIGQEQRVKIELRNPGTGDASGVMLFENVPQNVKHASGPALEFDIGTLKAGETRELELVLMAEKAGKTVNVLSARADGNLQVQQQVEFEVIAPGLTVDVDGPERRYLERPATYEVRVDNPGSAPAHNVQIVTKLPKGLRFVRANNKGEYDASTHAVYWSLAELPEGESGTVELVAMPIEAGPQTLQVEGKAGQGLSDEAQQQIVVDGIAAIMFEVKDLEDPIEVGGETGYEVRVVNQGTKAATNVQIAVNLPPGMQLVSAEGETPHANQGGNIVFEPLAQLAPKADTVYRLRVQGTAAGDQRVTVQVNTDDLAQPIRREESTLVFGDE